MNVPDHSEEVPADVRRPRGRRGTISVWLLVDVLMWMLALTAAVWMRFDLHMASSGNALRSGRFLFVEVVVITLIAIGGLWSGLYRGRYVRGSLLEASVLTGVFLTVALVVFVGVVLMGSSAELPRSVPLIAGAFSVIGSLALRSFVRRNLLFGAKGTTNAEPVIVFGAGIGGMQLIHQLRRSGSAPFRPVAILDDDPDKQGMIIDGVRVCGGRDDIAECAATSGAGTLLLAIPSLDPTNLVRLRDLAEASGLHVLTLPPLDAMMKGRASVDELRKIDVLDLLGRSPARLNQTQIADYLHGKSVLVTGAGGSIGSELCRQLSVFAPAEIIMLDRDESGLHAVQLSLQDKAMLDGDDTVLASIRDRESIFRILDERRPDIVFHAAALKHMPLLEQYPVEAYKTNVLGTRNVLDAARAAGVGTFINISTDKAANPSTVLGTSKRVAERLTAAAAENTPEGVYVSVRFGNVLGSRGSVLTTFERQIEEGGPITVTDPEVNRYFMTIPEACQLVLQAAAVGESGQTLVLDMGEPVKIADMARALIEKSGKDIEIVYTGLRANEKISEKLFDDSETPVPSRGHESLSTVTVPPFEIVRSQGIGRCDDEQVREWMATVSCGAADLTRFR